MKASATRLLVLLAAAAVALCVPPAYAGPGCVTCGDMQEIAGEPDLQPPEVLLQLQDRARLIARALRENGPDLLYEQSLASAPEMSALITAYLDDIAAAAVDPLIAPGCFSHTVLAFESLFMATPYFLFWTYDSITFYDGGICAWMYGLSSLESLCVGLIHWANYRICEAEWDDPNDQDDLARFRNDRNRLLLYAAALSVPLAVSITQCDEPLFQYLFPYFVRD